MYVSIKLTPSRLLAAVTAVLCVILVTDAVKQARLPDEVVLSSDFERAEYLKQHGLNVSASPEWTKRVVLSEQPDKAQSEYIAVLESQGYTIDEHIGERLEIYCYQSLENADVYARVLMNGSKLVGADKYVVGNSAVSIRLDEKINNATSTNQH